LSIDSTEQFLISDGVRTPAAFVLLSDPGSHVVCPAMQLCQGTSLVGRVAR
jgi:hypothetical protein